MYEIPDLDTVCVFLHKQFNSNMKDCHGRTQISKILLDYMVGHKSPYVSYFLKFMSVITRVRAYRPSKDLSV